MQIQGYTDTPVIPGSTWTVHDPRRPQPTIVRPGLPGGVPSDAIVLFDGKSLDNWEGNDGRANWKVENGYAEVVPGSGNIRSKMQHGDGQIHLEFASPSIVRGSGQGRGNSGVFLQGIYEIQILDGFENPVYADGITGAIYGQFPPLVNACREPGEWQSYDIIWRGPVFEGHRVLRPAMVTVLHNGIVIHHAQELQGETRHKELASYTPHGPTGSLVLQDHGDLVRFRNIWYRPIQF